MVFYRAASGTVLGYRY